MDSFRAIQSTLELVIKQCHRFSFSAAGHFADGLIGQKWSVLSVRRLMTSIGLLGPGIFILFFSAVDNVPLAIL